MKGSKEFLRHFAEPRANFVRMFGLLKDGDRPAIHAYIDRCCARPAYARAMALDAEAAL